MIITRSKKMVMKMVERGRPETRRISRRRRGVVMVQSIVTSVPDLTGGVKAVDEVTVVVAELTHARTGVETRSEAREE